MFKIQQKETDSCQLTTYLNSQALCGDSETKFAQM